MRGLRSLPRIFIPRATGETPFELPEEELKKLRHVLRLSAGAHIAVLPNDGTIIECEFRGREAIPLQTFRPETEAKVHVTVAQAFPKGDKLDDIVKACTGIGVAEFVLFPSDRSVVRWDEKKREDRIRRMRSIIREESEVTFRTRLATVELASNLKQVLERFPDAHVLSEVEGVPRKLPLDQDRIVLVVGPEGGWSKGELDLIGTQAVTLGPRVLRVEHAAAAAASVLLLS